MGELCEGGGVSAKPTGKIRYRSERRFFGGERLVLQIEEECSEMEMLGPFPDRVTWRRWRDAKTTDLKALEGSCPNA